MCFGFLTETHSQQDPQYTQYMFNTISVNPAYAGSREGAVLTTIGRSQWVGFNAGINTQILSYDTSIEGKHIGLGVNLVNDKIGPSSETYVDANVCYAIELSYESNLAFGLKIGGRLLNIDWSKGYAYDGGDTKYMENINNKFMMRLGAGIYYYTRKMYVGLAVPNFLVSEHYQLQDIDKKIERVEVQRMHFYFIAGYVFDLKENLKFKPAVLSKIVSGAPPSYDISANFLFNNKFRAGIAYRVKDSVSALLGFQVTEFFDIGYAYDLTTSNYKVQNSGTHEIMFRYVFEREPRYKSPRFF